ncbi:hypothetical protein VTK26DRAFT_3582 [Humicola hyalothermophila]
MLMHFVLYSLLDIQDTAPRARPLTAKINPSPLPFSPPNHPRTLPTPLLPLCPLPQHLSTSASSRLGLVLGGAPNLVARPGVAAGEDHGGGGQGAGAAAGAGQDLGDGALGHEAGAAGGGGGRDGGAADGAARLGHGRRRGRDRRQDRRLRHGLRLGLRLGLGLGHRRRFRLGDRLA